MKDGGPAFPSDPIWRGHINPTLISKQSQGMSLRDWFAGQALAGLNANPEFTAESSGVLARKAYYQADAMLSEREAGK